MMMNAAGANTLTMSFSDGVERHIDVAADETVLQAAERQGLFLANDCREGTCGVCTGNCSRGEFTMDSTMALSRREQEQGKVLPCTLRAQSEGRLSFDYPSSLCKPQLRSNFNATVTAVEMISSAAARLTLSADDLGQTVEFAAGQFVSIQVPGTSEWRAYSMANRANADNKLEFFIRILPDGVMSNYLRDRAAVGDRLTLTPPKGSFSLHEVTRPLLLVAGGTGLSAIMAMLHELAAGDYSQQPIQLVYGVNTPEDICGAEQLEAFRNSLPDFSYQVVSVGDAEDWQGPVGFVTDVLDPQRLHGGAVDAYLCGPPPMIEAVERWFESSGLQGYNIHSERFNPAPARKSTDTDIVKGEKPHRRAVVVGGSIAGISAAKVLSEHFEEVIVLERDSGHDPEQTRAITPQAHHAHHLLQRGQRELELLFPGFLKELRAAGAQVYDSSKDYRNYQNGNWKVVCESGIDIYAMRRCLLETVLRRQLDKVPNIDYRYDCKVEQLVLDEAGRRVCGVRYQSPTALELLEADLVIDSSGKNAGLYKQLSNRGYSVPQESEMAFEIFYMTCLLKVKPEDVPDWSMMTMYNHRPYEKDVGYAAFYSEDKSTLLVSLGSYGCDKPARNYEEFLQRAKNLPQPHIYELLLKCERNSELNVFKYPRMFRRHYEKLDRVPEGFLALGDAFGSADPISGAGMTKAVLEVQDLAAVLRQHPKSLTGVPQKFYAAAARLFDYIWMVVGEQGLRYPWVEGRRPWYQAMLNRYVDHLLKVATYDKDAFVRYLRVVHFDRTLKSLLVPGVFFKVLKSMLKHGLKVPYQKVMPGEVREPIIIK